MYWTYNAMISSLVRNSTLTNCAFKHCEALKLWWSFGLIVNSYLLFVFFILLLQLKQSLRAPIISTQGTCYLLRTRNFMLSPVLYTINMKIVATTVFTEREILIFFHLSMTNWAELVLFKLLPLYSWSLLSRYRGIVLFFN